MNCLLARRSSGLLQLVKTRLDGSVTSSVTKETVVSCGAPSHNLDASRSIVRWHWRHPSEIKRMRKSGWRYRMSTENQRELVMRNLIRDKWNICSGHSNKYGKNNYGQ